MGRPTTTDLYLEKWWPSRCPFHKSSLLAKGGDELTQGPGEVSNVNGLRLLLPLFRISTPVGIFVEDFG